MQLVLCTGANNYKWKESLSVCPSIISTTVHPIDFILGGCIAEDPRKCSVKCEVVWMSGSRESCKQQYRRPSIRPVLNGHITALVMKKLWKTTSNGRKVHKSMRIGLSPNFWPRSEFTNSVTHMNIWSESGGVKFLQEPEWLALY